VPTYNFAVCPFELCFELSYVNTSLMLPGSNTALKFSFSRFCLCITALYMYFSFGHSSYELISSDSSLKVSCHCNAYGVMKLMVRMDCLIVNYLQIVYGGW